MKKKILLVLLLFFCVVVLAGCSNSQHNTLDEKVTAEIQYLDSELIEMLNSLNNISFEKFKLKIEKIEDEEQEGSSESKGSEDQQSGGQSSSNQENNNSKSQQSKESNELNNKKMSMEENNFLVGGIKTNWDIIKNKIELVIQVWGQMVLDLREVGIDENDIQEVEKELNKLIISIKNEDKIETATTFSKVYSYIPKFLEKYSANKLEISLKKVKSNIINAYTVLEQDDWNKVRESVEDSKKYIEEAKKISSESNEKVYDVKKIEVLINELQGSLEEEDKDIYYMRYKNLMQEFE